jgi:glycosyltransferase involved in cell wall biosynthesis
MHYYDFALCAELQRNGVDITLLTCDETAAYAPPGGLKVRYPFHRIFGQESALLRGYRYHRGLRTVAAAAAVETPQIAHLHYFLVPVADIIFLRQLHQLGMKIVVTAHDVVPFNARLHTKAVLQQVYGRADGIIVHAEHNRRELLAQFQLDEGRVTVIPHGHYLAYTGAALQAREDARAALRLGQEAPTLLFFGQIKRVKGLDTLLQALPAVAAQHPHAVLVVAGQVWKDSWHRYQAIIDELGLADHVRTRIAHIPDSEVEAYFRAADVVVLPYRRVYQSGVLLMAWSYGRPVVASDVGGMGEVVKHGETGLLVPPDEPVSLARAINELLSDRSRAEAMGAAGRTVVEAEFAWNRIAQRTIALYTSVAGSTPRSKGSVA